MNIFNYKRCGVVILWVNGKIMLCERRKGKFRGYFGVAGGKIESDESILVGVLREFGEETGASLYNRNIEFLDCYILPKAEQKVFIFESLQPLPFWNNIKNTEPEKHGKWNLYTKEQALKLQLMPHIRQYLESIDPQTKLPKI